jgi:hypothetical protein
MKVGKARDSFCPYPKSSINFFVMNHLTTSMFHCSMFRLTGALSSPKLMRLIKMVYNNLEEVSFSSFETCKP